MDYDMLMADLAGNAGGSKEVARRYAATIVKWVVRQVVEEGCLVINDFGKFLVEKHMEYVYLDAATMKRWLVPPRLSVKFIPAPLMEDGERDNGRVIPVITDVLVQQHQEKQLVARKYAVMFFKTILDAMEEGSPVLVDGLGSFLLTKVKVDDAIYGKVSFTSDESLLADINRPFSFFQPVELHEGVVFDDVETTTQRIHEDKGEQVFLIFKEEAKAPQERTGLSDLSPLSDQSEKSEKSEKSEFSEYTDHSNHPNHPDHSDHSDLSDYSDHSDHSDSSESSSSPIHWWKYAFLLLLLAVCLLAFFLMRGKGQSESVSGEDGQVLVEDTMAKDSVAGEKETVLTDVQVKTDDTESSSLDFARMNAQLPYCGYDIVGVASTITVTPGLTLETIARRYLGTDYTQYLVVLNDGNDNPQPGQKYMIPKLRLRKNK